MTKTSKRQKAIKELVDKNVLYSIDDAVGVLKKAPKTAFDQTVEISREDARCVLNRLLPHDLEVTRADEQGASTQLCHRRLKRNPGSRGRLFKKEAQRFPRQGPVLFPFPAHPLEAGGPFE